MSTLRHYDPLDDFFRGFFVRPVDFTGPAEAPTIRIDVRERENAYVVYAEMPGVRKEDIQVNIEGPNVSVSAERKQQEKDVKEGERVLHVERTFGKVSRSFQLGQDIDDAAASAKFADGVLELVLPKKSATQAKRLTIQ